MKRLRTLGLALLFLAGALASTVAVAHTVLGIPQSDTGAVAMLLIVVGGSVGACALVLMQPAVLGRIGGVRGQLVGASLVGSLLLLGMTMAGARAMFISPHDLAVVLTMLLFAAQLAVGFSLLWATPIARRLERLRA